MCSNDMFKILYTTNKIVYAVWIETLTCKNKRLTG